MKMKARLSGSRIENTERKSVPDELRRCKDWLKIIAPILGDLYRGANLYQCTKPSSCEKVWVQKEWMNLRRSLWKCEKGKRMNLSTLENYNRKWTGWKKIISRSFVSLWFISFCLSKAVDIFHPHVSFFLVTTKERDVANKLSYQEMVLCLSLLLAARLPWGVTET